MHRISVAPMLDVTYSHMRFFMRLLTKKSTLWTEMIHENAITHAKFIYIKR
jgi:tRNA-dihydrouridine synthase A